MKIGVWLDTFGDHDLDGQPIPPDYEFALHRARTGGMGVWAVQGPGGEHPTMTFEQVLRELRSLRMAASMKSLEGLADG